MQIFGIGSVISTISNKSYWRINYVHDALSKLNFNRLIKFIFPKKDLSSNKNYLCLISLIKGNHNQTYA